VCFRASKHARCPAPCFSGGTASLLHYLVTVLRATEDCLAAVASASAPTPLGAGGEDGLGLVDGGGDGSVRARVAGHREAVLLAQSSSGGGSSGGGSSSEDTTPGPSSAARAALIPCSATLALGRYLGVLPSVPLLDVVAARAASQAGACLEQATGAAAKATVGLASAALPARWGGGRGGRWPAELAAAPPWLAAGCGAAAAAGAGWAAQRLWWRWRRRATRGACGERLRECNGSLGVLLKLWTLVMFIVESEKVRRSNSYHTLSLAPSAEDDDPLLKPASRTLVEAVPLPSTVAFW